MADSRQTTIRNDRNEHEVPLTYENVHEQLQDTVEALRAAEYPHLDAELVALILTIEELHLDLRSGVLVRLEQAVDAFLHESETL